MKRLQFNAQGKLVGVDGEWVQQQRQDEGSDDYLEKNGEIKLKTSESLSFLKQDITFNEIKDESSWSLYNGEIKLLPLKFSNGKTQEDVVREIVDLIKKDNKVIFLHGVCGTGKSAIALNIARLLGKTAIVVPVKSLQTQYEEDYTQKKYLLKQDGRKMKIAMISGRENHDSIVLPGVSCADLSLPENIKITEKNYDKILDYYHKNPGVKSKENPDIKDLKRISIAPANPYWSPILPASYEVHMLKDAKKKRYQGLSGKEFIFYHRKEGCSYYDQYQAYLDADILVYNSAKYKIEVALDRKPKTEVDIIDEADEFLDNLSTQDEINLTRLANSLNLIKPYDIESKLVIKSIEELLEFEHKNKTALGIDEKKIFHIKETQIKKLLDLISKSPEVEVEISLDEANYANKLIELANNFKDLLDDTYVTFKRKDKDLYAYLVTTNVSKKLNEIISKNKTIVLMSGTLHSQNVLKHVFGLSDFKIVEAETLQQGAIDINKTGKEIDCRYNNFTSGKNTREQYLRALESCLSRATKPYIVHVNAFEDLPNENEILLFKLNGFVSKERLLSQQYEDKTGKSVSLFKAKLSDVLFTTKCSRGVDFPGDVCNSIIFTKYPNPNIQGTFWKILQRTHSGYFWEFYRDKARREFLQRIYRAIRSKDDHVFILSPDSRVLDAVRELQILAGKK